MHLTFYLPVMTTIYDLFCQFISIFPGFIKIVGHLIICHTNIQIDIIGFRFMAPPIEKDGVARNGKISGPINLWRNIVDQLFLDPVPTVGKKGIIMTLTVCLASCGIYRLIY